MGCDIHPFVEARESADAPWVSVQRWAEKDEDGWASLAAGQEIAGGRCYGLFALLAGVRNRAGVKPIAEPRGIPDDCDARIRDLGVEWGGDGHSHSWLTLAEILAFDWTAVRVESGILNAVELERFDRTRWFDDKYNPNTARPSSWCQGSWGPGIVEVSEGVLREKIQALRKLYPDHREFDAQLKAQLGRHQARCEWPVMHSAVCSAFWWRDIPRMLRFGKPENVRMVFWFDN
ncbi:MAG: hypothetical protein ACPGVG_14615 [Mycobacterium sp.]